MKQLNKLIQVIEVKDITLRACVERELMLVKIKCENQFFSFQIGNSNFAKGDDLIFLLIHPLNQNQNDPYPDLWVLIHLY